MYVDRKHGSSGDNVSEHRPEVWSEEPSERIARITSFEKSDWWTRGWTLQELLAPKALRFYDSQWRPIGTKTSRSDEIYKATKIEPKYLSGNFSGACIAVKMSWAAGRTTTIRDDIAYCMLGIFGIQMDVRYGEEEGAFLRLQEQLVEKFQDESIFAWTIGEDVLEEAEGEPSFGMLAPWPTCFQNCGNLTIDCDKLYRPRNGVGYTTTRQGIQFEIPGRLPDQGNGVEWNNLIANYRSSYALGLNCWIKGRQREGSVTIALWKDEKRRWRRMNVGQLIIGKNLRKSFMLTFPKTRPYWIPHQTAADEDWGRILADRTESQIEAARAEE